MLMITWALCIGLLCPSDTISHETTIDEVVVSATIDTGKKATAKGHVASIDEHLAQLSGVEMVRRGSYAWEPVVNSMSTERVSTTIDGMKIFYACTDKMDPVTSYVESGNLQRITLNSGLDGNPQATGNIGGSLDLKLRRVGFDAKPSEYNMSAGYESNGDVQVYGADAALSSHRFYTNFGLFYRHAGNYKAGGGEELPFSQFRKTNAFANIGWRLADNHIIEGTFIYDIATDVGYPALNMDVRRAQGIISAFSFRRENMQGWFYRSEIKAYYNRILHDMDDTQRPDVIIHMDMPGRSQTAGVYSLLQGNRGAHNYQLNYDAYYNTLFADMTMYSGGAAPMYMLTWPDVSTFNTGVALNDDINLNEHHRIRLSAKGAWQRQHIGSDEGFQALSIYFPGMGRGNSRFIGRLAATYQLSAVNYQLSLGTGLGMRAPTVTESYGYFLNNTFDRYDYIGNPHLKNETAIEVNAAAKLSILNYQLSIGIEGNAFFLQNYIIGRPDTRLSAMTIGAAGVKVYQNLPSAQIINATLTADYAPLRWLTWKNRLSYSYGRESNGARLPLIAPLTYQGSLQFLWRNITVQCGVRMAARNSHCGSLYGETPTPSYVVWNLNIGSHFRLGRVSTDLNIGVENLFDRHFSTYSDWNHIPQKGRNIYINTAFQL